MKTIKYLISILDEQLIKKAFSIQNIFSDSFKNKFSEKDKKLWKTILLYKEIISNYAIENISSSLTKLITILDDKTLHNEESWLPTTKVANGFISYIEIKDMIWKQNTINEFTLIQLFNLLNKTDVSTLESNLKLNNDQYELLKEMQTFIVNRSATNDFSIIIKTIIVHIFLISNNMFLNVNDLLTRFICMLIGIIETGNDYPKILMNSYLLKNKQKYHEYILQLKNDSLDINEFVSFLMLGYSESDYEIKKIYEDVEQILDYNIKSLINIFPDINILELDYKNFCNHIFLDKNIIKNFFNIDDNKTEKYINIMIDQKIIQYVSNANKNKLIFSNVWNYLNSMDNQLIKSTIS